jgi:hypothetical protein
MSRFPPVPLERPLEVFGKAFVIELSSGLTLGPDTVLRAALGKSLQTLLREAGKLLPIKQLRDGLQGRHRLSKTTRATVRAALGPIGDQFIGVLDGRPIPSELDHSSDWACLGATWGSPLGTNALHVVVSSFIELDKFVEAIAACASMHGREAAERMLQDRFGHVLPAWRELCPLLSLDGCLRIESSLLVIAELEATLAAEGDRRISLTSPTLELLSPRAKPLGNWIREVATTVKCSNNRELADLLARKDLRQKSGRAITHDTLKGWSAMKPGMLMSLDGCQSLLAVVSAREVADSLLARFALARFLAFLCDFLRSSLRAEPPSWPEVQRVVMARFQQLARKAAVGC